MIKAITGVYSDASEPPGTMTQLAGYQQPIEVPRGEHLLIVVTVRRQNREALDLTGSTLRFGVRHLSGDEAASISAEVTPEGVEAEAGQATFTIEGADTEPLIELMRYRYDIWLVDADEHRWQLVPTSEFKIAQAIEPGPYVAP